MAKEFDINDLPLPLVHRDFTFTAKDIEEDKKLPYHDQLRKLTVEDHMRRAAIRMSRDEQDTLEPNEEEITMATQTRTYTVKPDPTETGIYLVWGKGVDKSKADPFVARWVGPTIRNPQQDLHWRTVSTCYKQDDDRMPGGTVGDWEGPLMLDATLKTGLLSLNEIQTQIREWANRNFGQNISKRTGQELNEICPFMGIVEELGELAHAELKSHQGIRGFDDPKVYTDARDDALSDILVYLCDFAGRQNPPVDLQKILNKVWSKVRERDWQKNKVNAAEVAEAVDPGTPPDLR